MHVASVETEVNLSRRPVQDSRLLADRPVARKRPLIERQSRGRTVDLDRIESGGFARREVLHTGVPDIRLRRLQVLPVSRRFEAAAFNRHGVLTDTRRTALLEQTLNGSLRRLVLAFSKLLVTNAPVGID